MAALGHHATVFYYRSSSLKEICVLIRWFEHLEEYGGVCI